ncbi:MAG: hypothetical protein AABX71_00115, partial [Nanoarchaeota archaeon]
MEGQAELSELVAIEPDFWGQLNITDFEDSRFQDKRGLLVTDFSKNRRFRIETERIDSPFRVGERCVYF